MELVLVDEVDKVSTSESVAVDAVIIDGTEELSSTVDKESLPVRVV